MEASRAEVSLVGEGTFGLVVDDFCFLEGLLVCAMGLLVVETGVVGSGWGSATDADRSKDTFRHFQIPTCWLPDTYWTL